MSFYLDPGELNTELSLQQSMTVYDETGGFAESWTEMAVLFAKIEPVSAKATFEADQTAETVTHRITMRWMAGVASGMRFAKSERLFEISTVHDPDETARYLVCEVTEKGA